MLIVDETADEKSSADCAGAARQYSGTLGGIAMCQVAVTLTYASPAGHALIGRALYLPADWAADEERRELAGVPDEVMFATKPQLAGDLLQHAHDRGIRAGFVAGDEVYGGLDLRRSIRERGTGYVLAVRSNYMVTLPSGRRLTVKNRRQPGQTRHVAADAHRLGHQGSQGLPLGDDRDHARRHPRGATTTGTPFLLLRRHRYTGTVSYLPVLEPGPVPLAKLIIRGRHPVENRGRSPAVEAGQRAGQRPGHHLDLLAPLDRDQPARLRLPRRGRRLAARPRRQRRHPRADPRHRALSCSGSSAGPSSPSPAATRPTATPGRSGDAATSTTPSKPTSAGTPTPTSATNNDLQLP